MEEEDTAKSRTFLYDSRRSEGNCDQFSYGGGKIWEQSEIHSGLDKMFSGYCYRESVWKEGSKNF